MNILGFGYMTWLRTHRRVLSIWVLLGLLAALYGVGSGMISLPATASPATEHYRRLLTRDDNYRETTLHAVTRATRRVASQAELTPPESARLLAFVSNIYADALAQEQSPPVAQELARRISQDCWPDLTSIIDRAYAREGLSVVDTLDTQAQGLLGLYVFRAGHDLPLPEDALVPSEVGKWFGEDPAGPLSPQAGAWNPWLIPDDATFAVPAPAAPGSTEYEAEKAKVIDAVESRTETQAAAVRYWGGESTDGEYPADIWLNIMYRELPSGLSEEELAQIQKFLTQSIADAFIAAWQTKYTYWSERPDMAIEGLEPLIPNPYFPGYVSGHATVSQTAADILSRLVPARRDYFQARAQEAAESRLWGGVHFEMDNLAGQQLGRDVAASILTRNTPPSVVPAR